MRNPTKARSARWNNAQKFIFFLFLGLALLLLFIFLYLILGTKTYSISDVFQSIFNYTESVDAQYYIHETRMPRLIADLIVGASLSVAGIIMQGTTKNPMADSGIMGISQGSTLGVVVIVAFFPTAGRYEKMGMDTLGAALVTALIYLVAIVGRRKITTDRMVLSGMAISTLLSSLSSAIILKNGLMNEMVRYTSGSSANTIWSDVHIALPFFTFGVITALVISRSLTVMNLGEDVSKGLGANTKVVGTLSIIIVLILSTVAVVIIGPVSYIGLMIPYIARYLVGTDYRFSLPICAIYGGVFVLLVDLIAKMIKPGLEFPIGLLITLVGVPFFIYTARRQKGDQFHG